MPLNNPLLILDVLPPIITCPPNINGNTDPEAPTKRVTWAIPQASDNAQNHDQNAVPKLTTSHPHIKSPYDFAIGTTRIVYTATDKSNLTSSCTMTITVSGEYLPFVQNNRLMKPRQERFGTVQIVSEKSCSICIPTENYQTRELCRRKFFLYNLENLPRTVSLLCRRSYPVSLLSSSRHQDPDKILMVFYVIFFQTTNPHLSTALII